MHRQPVYDSVLDSDLGNPHHTKGDRLLEDVSGSLETWVEGVRSTSRRLQDRLPPSALPGLLPGVLWARVDLHLLVLRCPDLAGCTPGPGAGSGDDEQPPYLALGLHHLSGCPGAAALPRRRPGEGDQRAGTATPGAAGTNS